MTMFADTIDLWDRCYRHLDRINARGFNRDLGCEIRQRLQQLDYIVTEVRALERITIEASLRSQAAFEAHIEDVKRRGANFDSEPVPKDLEMTPEEMRADRDAMFKLELLTEAFYFFAWRVCAILKSRAFSVPGLRSFDSVGVRNTRNKLLEHPEGKDSNVFIRSLAWAGSCGPVIKAVREDNQREVFPDAGLYVNAEEFRSNLERAINACLSGTPASTAA